MRPCTVKEETPFEPAHDAAAHMMSIQAPLPPNEPPIPLPETLEVTQRKVPWEPNQDDEMPPAPIQAAEPDAPSPPKRSQRTIRRPKRLIEGNIAVGLALAFSTLASRLGPHLPTESRSFTLLHS
jgi:hypothetical protein